ncbi:hypothetical protein ACH5RR_018476 [Cinchona calisaya]|uniref:Uncharacterized protein n=1 Tax=Cinchona calisaya TaxID=153742 RepID=A0ABD2ZPD6_9GENT
MSSFSSWYKAFSFSVYPSFVSAIVILTGVVVPTSSVVAPGILCQINPPIEEAMVFGRKNSQVHQNLLPRGGITESPDPAPSFDANIDRFSFSLFFTDSHELSTEEYKLLLAAIVKNNSIKGEFSSVVPARPTTKGGLEGYTSAVVASSSAQAEIANSEHWEPKLVQRPTRKMTSTAPA